MTEQINFVRHVIKHVNHAIMLDPMPVYRVLRKIKDKLMELNVYV